ncbi:A/G-specific adenine glycosylase [Actinocrinis puniceicyclus]|uniref:Adenine DNA glycosylase n=1 Tax=Actinocrinis puniceicyclus TaxID=977794 RepID=A0A8J7WQP0_9ACTN|nr:A/G-specific adenine glycosylase [Actinocrinis puniceicyclus]MBS2966746.1 A/G-specific adenine glycosylase [Actinocrinis puniceicyclus]
MPSQTTAASTAVTAPGATAAPDCADRAGVSQPPEHADEVTERTRAWFALHRRDLPWRDPHAGAWAVMVSEFMLQQTPVARVLPVYESWVARWPEPSALAAEEPGEAVRAWGRLGYPRRALRLHAAATSIVQRHGGQVPDDYEALRALPGVGEYTAAAIASFAFGRRAAVLDTNVRRVLARVFSGVEFPADSLTAAERALATALLPSAQRDAAAWAAASMELGALLCTAKTPDCARCPITELCAWHRLGRPPHDGPPRRGQIYAGTDRQARGRLLAVLRESRSPVGKPALDAVWHAAEQRERALAGLLADGLAVELRDGTYRLP